jgi:hypothetical protein
MNHDEPEDFIGNIKATEAANAAREAAIAPAQRPRRRSKQAVLVSYVQRALEAETDAVASQKEPGRNDRLNESAFNLGQLVGAGVLAREVAEQELVAAARACGLDQDHKDGGLSAVLKTIASGLNSGAAKPRDLSDVGTEIVSNGKTNFTPQSNGWTPPADEADGIVTIIEGVQGSRVSSTKPMWVWDYNGVGRMQLGTLVLFAGKPAAGKSTAVRWFMARLSKGELPGVWDGHPMNVSALFIEEQRKAVVVPSLRLAGADMRKVWFPEFKDRDGNPRSFEIERDEGDLTQWLIDHEVRAFFIDPVMSTIGKSDARSNNEIREKLIPLTRVAEAINGVVVAVTHLNKGDKRDLMDAVHSSTAFVEVPRSIFGFAPADDGEHIMEQVKNSAGVNGLKLKYTLPISYDTADDGQAIEMPTFRIEGETEISITDINTSSDETTGIAQAKDWLKFYLLENQPAASAQIKIDAKKHGDIQPWTLKRAMKELHVRVWHTSAPGKPHITVWSLPDFEMGPTGT